MTRDETVRPVFNLGSSSPQFKRSVLDLFQQSNFDAERSVFDDSVDPDRLMAAILRDEIDGSDVWRELAEAQVFRPMRSEWVATDGHLYPAGGSLLDAIVAAAGQAMEASALRGFERGWRQSPTISFRLSRCHQ